MRRVRTTATATATDIGEAVRVAAVLVDLAEGAATRVMALVVAMIRAGHREIPRADRRVAPLAEATILPEAGRTGLAHPLDAESEERNRLRY